jgi:hypothetical protein
VLEHGLHATATGDPPEFMQIKMIGHDSAAGLIIHCQ